MELMEAIPSFKLSENIVFCSYNSKTSMKAEDPPLALPRNKKIYYDKIEKVNPYKLIYKTFDHLVKKLVVEENGKKEEKLKISNPIPFPDEVFVAL